MLVARDHRLSTVNARLDAALERRVRLHQERAAGTIDVAPYIQGLREVRHTEDELERVRRRAGRTVSRAVELCAHEGHAAAARLVIEAETERYGATPPDPAAAVLASLSTTDRAQLLAGERPHSAETSSTSSGPCRPQITWRSKRVEVEAFTAAEWAREVAYHAYWKAHNYDTLNADLKAASPPNPPTVRRSVQFTFPQLRKMVEAENGGQLVIDPERQLSSRKRDWRCEECRGTNDVAGWPRRCVECQPPHVLDWKP